MRGKGAEGGTNLRNVRITPAYAGKSSAIFVPEKALEDHPRLCGEKEADVQFLFHSLGSPPPMRGKACNASS